jgi:hypothetical protein
MTALTPICWKILWNEEAKYEGKINLNLKARSQRQCILECILSHL